MNTREVGVRELKRSLSETLRAVSRGEQIRVTLRGRPIADIVPAGPSAVEDRLRRLVAEGRLVLPARPRPEQAPKPVQGRCSATEVVHSEREAKR
ncbi:MAG: prevent-host-death protein [Acidimicrobiales bacterium]|nr:MAG: prevent-host-death protein [Acidimicrobiales bacterium]